LEGEAFKFMKANKKRNGELEKKMMGSQVLVKGNENDTG